MSEAKQPAAVDVVDSDNEDLSISHIWKKNKLPVKEELDSDDDEGTLLSTLRKKKVTKKSAKEEVIDSDEEIPIAALKVPKKRKIKLENEDEEDEEEEAGAESREIRTAKEIAISGILRRWWYIFEWPGEPEAREFKEPMTEEEMVEDMELVSEQRQKIDEIKDEAKRQQALEKWDEDRKKEKSKRDCYRSPSVPSEMQRMRGYPFLYLDPHTGHVYDDRKKKLGTEKKMGNPEDWGAPSDSREPPSYSSLCNLPKQQLKKLWKKAIDVQVLAAKESIKDDTVRNHVIDGLKRERAKIDNIME